MIVLAGVAVLATAATPNLYRLQQEWMLWGDARLLESSLQWGRMHAIASNTPMRFDIDENRQQFYWSDPSSGELYADSIRFLAGELRIVSCPKRSLRFYQHGNAAPAGTYTIQGKAGSYSVVVSPGGRIRIQRN